MPVPARKIRTPPQAIDFAAIRAELQVPTHFPPAAVREAERSAARPPRPPRDATNLPMVTLDPAGSRDLDQAVYIERAGSGYRVYYAIADVAAFVAADGALAAETWRRGVTLYSPDENTPLHPPQLSEGAASLLPDGPKPAVLWTISVDADGEPTDVRVERAMVASVARLDYAQCQRDMDAGALHPSIALLPEFGAQRQRLGRERHAISLDLPDSEVVRAPDGHWTIELRAVLPIEKLNAEVSLLTGMCAAAMMLDGNVGLLRTLPAPRADQVAALRSATGALGIPWPRGTPPGDVVAELDGSVPRDAAFLEDAVRLLRGAGYTAFDGGPPERLEHGGVGAPYAHVTAPLRRLADRYATEVCLALHSGSPIPDWVTPALPELPAAMAAADRKAAALTKACAGAVSVFLLHGREGEEFLATVLQIEAERNRATVVLHEPPVRASCAPDGLVEGSIARVRLESADPATHRFLVAPVPGARAPAAAG